MTSNILKRLLWAKVFHHMGELIFKLKS